MSHTTIWRYMSFAKYFDILRTGTLFFSKASSFSDADEGRWARRVYMASDKRLVESATTQLEALKGVLEGCAGDPECIAAELEEIVARNSDSFPIDSTIAKLKRLVGLPRVVTVRELEAVIEALERMRENYRTSEWFLPKEHAQFAGSTYVSCWSASESMSLAMWKLYGQNNESIAIRTSLKALNDVVEFNMSSLRDKGFDARVEPVTYADFLVGDDETEDFLRDHAIGMNQRAEIGHHHTFFLKHLLYDYEREIRAIVFPTYDVEIQYKEEWLGDGYLLPIARPEMSRPESLKSFIKAVHTHPELDSAHPFVERVRSLHELFGVGNINVEAQKTESMKSLVL